MSYKDDFYDRLSSRWTESDIIKFMKKHIDRLDREIKELKEKIKNIENVDKK